ncbi:DHHC zinc finger protein [Phlyctema vagabunda]|uniref:Palmitoyltransferase n=1 Tax=Phlyctema vagabunda TaxID=108571 RepID=A0ABR4PE66_9HELO
MGLLRNVAVVVLLISFFTFVTFFGRLPALRNTPVGALHRVLWIYLPRTLRALDQRLSNGRLSSSVGRLAHTLWNDRHPVVLIFFLLLLSVSEVMFLPPAWSLVTTRQKLITTLIVIAPYIFCYLSASSDPGYITAQNHMREMALYPYDFTIFYPGHHCRTCHLLKPARSKHCSICKRCVAKHDHHCIFINNCVGYNNIHWFLILLFTTGILTAWGAWLGLDLLWAHIERTFPNTGTSWFDVFRHSTWSSYFSLWAWIMQEQTRIAAITLLCILTTPLVWGLLGYHIYLIWAGTTTNESMKWSDWQAEMSDGYVFKRKMAEDRPRDLSIEPAWTRWPAESEQIVVRTEDGMPPQGAALGHGEWEQVLKLAQVENLYDLGFWDNLVDVFWPRGGLSSRTGVKDGPDSSIPASANGAGAQ